MAPAGKNHSIVLLLAVLLLVDIAAGACVPSGKQRQLSRRL
ncbi:hypothetical protein HU200_023305 [Digitaria exilis]|uniref:Uncharacterized protein n=1 Tax=Digitaria exilis TaxID=1010633 RepID=A0A835EXJ9_9POAL|nr:hypothetical protein HU200_023305 [Digitaria exilis]